MHEGKEWKVGLKMKKCRSGSGIAWLPGHGVRMLFHWNPGATYDSESAVSLVTICRVRDLNYGGLSAEALLLP